MTSENPKNIISNIRKNYGIKSDGTQSDDFAFISSNLKNAIEQLSTGLYGKDIHFILELIQNAEDNNYSNVSPDLKFVVLDDDPTQTPGSDGCLCVFNNESGFEKSNVESISQIGKSTKTKIQGYIGEKGIGFKSVFIVSESPHIYSNGYSFKFKENDTSIGLSYVVPYWLDSMPSIVNENSTNTAILLPLKPGKKTEIVNKLKGVKPETIIFLTKLENLSVDLRSESTSIDLIRDTTHKPIIDLLIQKNNKEPEINRYWLHSDIFSVPDDINEDKRKDVIERELTIAFPLDSNNAGMVFAFLPTEEDSGFPFLINTDFMLTANRESIKSDTKWNRWLRDELAGLIVQGLTEISKDDNYVKNIYGYIPLVEEINSLKEYFSPVCESVHKILTDKEIILTDMNKYVLSSIARLASKKVRKLFGGNTRSSAFNDFSFVNLDIEKHSKRLQAIGVKNFSHHDFKNCISDYQWLSSKDISWFYDLYEYAQGMVKPFGTTLNKLKAIPTQNKRLVSSSQQQIYFPSNHKLIKNIEKVGNASEYPEVSFLNEELLVLLSNNKELLAWVTNNFEIIDFSISTYIGSTLVPWLNDNVDNLNEQTFLSSMHLVLEFWSDITAEVRKIIGKKCPVLLENGKIINPDKLKGTELLVPRLLDKEKGWQIILKNEEDYSHVDVLSNKYISLVDIDSKLLAEFFSSINAETIPDLRQYSGSRHAHPSILYISNIFNGFNDDYSEAPALSTWMPPLFFYDEEQRRNKKNRLALLHWLDAILEHRETLLKYGVIKWFYYAPKSRQTGSGLYYYLTKEQWISTSKGLKKPGEVFVESKQIKEMFGNRLAYLKDDISPELCEFLGIKSEVTNRTVLDYLHELSKTTDVDIKLIKKLYKYLDDYGDDFSEEFLDEKLIYIPNSEKKWYSSSQVIWDDNSKVLGKLYGWLSDVYESSDLKKFFLNKLNVSETVKNEDLAKAWLQLPNRIDLNPEDIEASLDKIYPQLLIESKSLDEHPDWWHEFTTNVKLWTQGDEFVDNDEVYAADDTYLRNLFNDELNFIWKPVRFPHNALSTLYSELSISLLSESIDVSLDNSGDVDLLITPLFITEHSKLLLCYLIFNDSPEKYEELIKSGALKELLQSVEAKTDSLEIRYDVTGSWVSKTVNDKNAFLDISKRLLYFCSEVDHEDVLDDVAEVIARSIWGTFYKKHEDHVRITLSILNEDRFKKIRDKKGWNLPPDIRKEAVKLIAKSGQVSSEDTPEPSKEPEPKPESEKSGPTRSGDSASSSGSTGRQSGQSAHNGRDYSSSGRQQSKNGVHSGSGKSSGSGQSGGASSGSVSGNRSRAGKSRSQGIASSSNQARRNQMRSYVANEYDDDLNSNSDEDFEAKQKAQEARNELGRQGELEVVDDLKAKGYVVTRMPENNKGYDIEAINPATSEILYIEVKGDSFNWNDKGVGISPSQYHFGLEKRSSFYLAVVENLRSSPRTIYYIQDPMSQITQYRFDSEWVGVSTSIKSVKTGELINQSVVEALSEQTESDICKDIIKYCDEQGYPYPDIGIELVNDAGAVIFEDIELAWEHESIGVLLSQDERDEAEAVDNQWSFYVVDDYSEITNRLDAVFNIDTKCE
jgi:hypothetical protein